ncbi:MAG TPA: hypothetical protein VNX68_09485, partial [Nitrosopumilaceae archaeon]|nr:hypothetical protein [Nitrosopumilaceae archaeon]
CSICNNLAHTENQWCHHLRYHKGQTDSDTGKPIYENNKGLTGLEVSWIVTGLPADSSAKTRYLLKPQKD